MAESDFQPVIRNRRGSSVKYPEQQQSLAAMSFKTSLITAALDVSHGDLNSAIVILLGEIDPSDPGTVSSHLGSKSDITTKVHNKIMATYKVQKCKEKNSHDIGKCVYWHTKADRRRNPFDSVHYGCMECCPDNPGGRDNEEMVPCREGDACLRAHNKHEKMFHPDIFKMTMCQRGEANGAKCSRGVFCAFAHSYDDSRKTSTSYRNTIHSVHTVFTVHPVHTVHTVHTVPSPSPPPSVTKAPVKPVTNISNGASTGLSPGSVIKKIINPEAVIVVTPNVTPVVTPVVAPVLTPAAMPVEMPVVAPVAVPDPVIVTIPVVDSIAPPLSVIGHTARRRGPSEPASNQSLELSHFTSPPTLTPDNSFLGYYSEVSDINSFPLGLSPSPSMVYRNSPSSSGSSLSNQMSPHQLSPSSQDRILESPPVSGTQQRIIRRRGPSGPVDNHFLGLLSSSSSPPTHPTQPFQSIQSMQVIQSDQDQELTDRSNSSINTINTLNTNNTNDTLNTLFTLNTLDNRTLQGRVTSLEGDLLLKDHAIERKDLELRNVLNKLKESQDLTSAMCAANDSMALAIQRLRNDLANTQLLLCQKDEDLTLTTTMLKDRERSLSPLTMMMGASGVSNVFPDLNNINNMNNMRAMLSSVESDYESRLIKMTFKI